MRKFTNLILELIFLAGLSLILYPTVSDWWNSMHQSRAVASYVEEVANMSAEEGERKYEAAVAYNRVLAQAEPNYFLSEEEEKEYNETLDITGTRIMGYIEIPKIKVQLPIYHGTDESILEIAVGHIAGSSLPAGGESTHCVLSGHRGLPSAKLFTDVDKLIKGDRFILTVLDHTLTYEVDQIHIVLPDELEDLKIEEGKDYCTLVTCTPYGINTHRLLIRGHRIANVQGEVRVSADALKVDTKFVALAIGVVLAILSLLFFSRPGRDKRKWKRRR